MTIFNSNKNITSSFFKKKVKDIKDDNSDWFSGAKVRKQEQKLVPRDTVHGFLNCKSQVSTHEEINNAEVKHVNLQTN